jgi:protein brassinosteroid insensitive 1
VNFISGKTYVYIKNDGSKECHGAGNLLELSGIRLDQLNRISARNPCNFTRVYGGKIQPEVYHNGSMIFLDISHNLLSGSLPKEIGSMFYLYILNLGHNNFSGTIPLELGDLAHLSIIDLSSNRFEGTILQSMIALWACASLLVREKLAAFA